MVASERCRDRATVDPVSIDHAEVEGVYDLTIDAIERGTLRWGKTVLTRNMQTVVVADMTPKVVEQQQPWAKIHELDPTNKTWAEKLRQSWNLAAAALGNEDVLRRPRSRNLVLACGWPKPNRSPIRRGKLIR